MRKIMAQEMIELAKRLYSKDLLAAADGNISCRLDTDRILITPSGKAKAFLSPEDFAVVAIQTGETLEGKASSETLMHLTVYRQCPQAQAVVHAHPPTAIAWSIAQPELKALPAECLSELIIATGGVPFVPYACPGTQQMGQVLLPFLPRHRVMILSRHGALTWGESIEEAGYGMERVEHAAKTLMLAKQMGGLTALPSEEVRRLKEIRQAIGENIL